MPCQREQRLSPNTLPLSKQTAGWLDCHLADLLLQNSAPLEPQIYQVEGWRDLIFIYLFIFFAMMHFRVFVLHVFHSRVFIHRWALFSWRNESLELSRLRKLSSVFFIYLFLFFYPEKKCMMKKKRKKKRERVKKSSISLFCSTRVCVCVWHHKQGRPATRSRILPQLN